MRYHALIDETMTYEKDVWTPQGMKPFYRYHHIRSWKADNGTSLTDQQLKKYNWSQPNELHQVYIGTLWKKKNTKTSKKS